MTELGTPIKLPFKVWGFPALEKGAPMGSVGKDGIKMIENPEYKSASLRIRINDKVTYDFNEDDIKELQKWINAVVPHPDNAP